MPRRRPARVHRAEAPVLRQGSRGLGRSPCQGQHVAASRPVRLVGEHARCARERRQRVERGSRAIEVRHGHGAIELRDRRPGEGDQVVAQRYQRASHVHRGETTRDVRQLDGGLQLVAAAGPAGVGGAQQRLSLLKLRHVPDADVLLVERHVRPQRNPALPNPAWPVPGPPSQCRPSDRQGQVSRGTVADTTRAS